jgi:hypothetical protein
VIEMTSRGKSMTAARMLCAALAAGICLLAGATSAFAASPAFKLTASSQTTNFAAGAEASEVSIFFPSVSRPQYSLIATNVGSAPTSGPVTFTDTLPAGLTPVGPGIRDFNFPFFTNHKLHCDVLGQTVTCTDPEPLQPGQWVQVSIPVDVAEDIGPTVTNEAAVLGGGAAEAIATTTTTISDSLPAFDFLAGAGGFSVSATGEDGAPPTQAGSHPERLTLDFGFPSTELEAQHQLYDAGGHLRNLKVVLPRGIVVNPNAIPARCTETQLNTYGDDGGCPVASQVGTIAVVTDLTQGAISSTVPFYNMVPPPGVAAELAFDALGVGIYVHVRGEVNSAGEFELGADTSNILARELNAILGVQVQLWGTPSDPINDAMRGDCPLATGPGCSRSVERTDVPFLTMPSSCRETLAATAQAASWEEPQVHSRSVQLEDSLGNPTGTDGCNKLDFEPSVEVKPTTNLADAPSGLDFSLHVPQSEGSENPATANFRDVRVTLPEGMSVNAASANGQEACSSAQIGLSTAIGQSPIHFTEAPASCPAAAKLGSVEVNTPALDHPLEGAVYLAKPFDNPFNSLLALYLDIEDPESGVVAKLAGRVDPNPQTGRLSSTFEENPELPIEDVKLSLFKGPRAPLRTPIACGTYATAIDITPWSSPEGADAHLSDSFATSVAASGSGACPSSEAAAPNSPSFTAGTVAPTAGAYSPFVLKLSREDGSQALTGLETTLPKGLVGKLAGIASCSEAAIAQAQARGKPNDGALEQRNPSCPASSEVGTLDVAAGAGITPFHASGHAYLAGPYKGAPLSFVFITPAVAGPFDLGAVTVRAAVRIDPETAQVKAISDPLPAILEGIPLDLRSVSLTMGRPSFTLNPTSCDPMTVIGSATSALGSVAPLSSPFQVGGCAALPYKPKLATRLSGRVTRGGNPGLQSTFTAKAGEAATARLSFALPRSEFIDQAHFRTICTRVQFAAKQCPAGSVYGRVKAFTPLLDYPLEGPIYLRSSVHQLPDVVLALHGPPSQPVEIDVVGKVDSKNGGVRTTFEAVPDAPLSKAIVTLQGGKKGLFQNSTNICRTVHRATLQLDGQNGKASDSRPAISVASCKGKGGKGRHHKGKR